jgi:DNA-binding transcriptional MocR family regulator
MTTKGWTACPNDLLLSELSDLAVRIHVYLTWRQGQNDHCWPCLRTIATELHSNRSSVIRAMQELVATGWVERVPRLGQSTLYNPLLEPLGGQPATGSPTRPARGSHEILEPTTKTKRTRKPKQPPTTRRGTASDEGDPLAKGPSGHREMVKKLATMCQVDLNIKRNWGWLGKEATALLDANYGISDLDHFLSWWLADDWRREHRPVPSTRDVREKMLQALQWANPTNAAGAAVLDLGANDYEADW